MANIGDPRVAVLLATTAYHGARATATATTRALLLERVAWANARLGDTQTTVRALADVDDAFTSSRPATDPAFTYWLTRQEIDIMAGRCLTELGQPDTPVTLLSNAIEHYDDTHQRELALYLSWLAQAHLNADDVDEAAAVATRSLRLAANVTSVRSACRIQHLRGILGHYRGNSAVDAFEDEARGLTRDVAAEDDREP